MSLGTEAHAPASRGMQLYLAGWCLMALSAIGYIGYLAYGGGLMTDGTPVATTSSGKSDGALSGEVSSPRVTRIDRELDALRKDVVANRAATEVLNEKVAELDTVASEFETRVTVIEEHAGLTQASHTDDAIQTTTPVADAPAEAQQQTAAVVRSGETGADQPPLQRISAGTEDEIVGVTVPEGTDVPVGTSPLDVFQTTLEPETPVPANVPLPGRPEFGVELAKGPNVEAIRLSWDLLRELHGNLLGGLSSRYVATEQVGIDRYRLIAGPLASAEAANALCQQLTIARDRCRATTFAGAAL